VCKLSEFAKLDPLDDPTEKARSGKLRALCVRLVEIPGELPKHQGRLYVLDGTDRNSSGNIGTSGRIEADRSAITAWIDLVHGNSDGLIHICSVGNWEGRTFSEPTDAADYAMRLDAEGAQGIYMRTTTLASVPRSGERGGDEASKTLPGFAADMDIAGPGHKTAKPLPTSPETCFAIISATGLPQPTLWVHSGGGVYPWWMFDQGVDLTEENSLTWAQTLSERLHETIAAWAEDLGWFYGAGVKDMSRVLRIPGTVNRKPGTEPRLAHVIQPAAYEFHHRDALEIAIDQAWRNRPKPKHPETPRSAPVVRPEGSSLRPGDDFNDRAHWADILTPHGWTYMYHRGSTWYWRRPGKDSGEHSATTGRKGVGSEDRLYVFSDATEFTQNEPYNKFAAYALLNHGGDFAAATRDLRSQGFGGELPQLHRATDAVSLVRPAAQVPVAVEPVDEQKPAESALAVQANKALPVLGHGDLLELDLHGSQDSIVTLRAVINAGHVPNLYVRDGQLVHVEHKSSLKNNQIAVSEVCADRLNGLLAHHVRTFKTVKDKDGNQVRKPFSVSVTDLRAVVKTTNWQGLPVLEGIIGTPTLRPDGSLIQEPGYDKATGLYFQPTIHVPRVPDTITDEQVRTSREFVFKKVFGEFCWVSPGDFANYMALLISPMLRPYVRSTTPFGMFTATTPGSGKTNLTDAIGFVYGQSSQVLPSRTEELQKKITAILIGNSSPVVVFDNLKEGTCISSEILATLVTKDTWDDRLLGASRSVEAANDRLWLASGNGLTVGGDMGSRTVMVRLDPRMERPELRNFEMGQFSDWIREDGNQEELLYHLLVLVQAWRQAGAVRDVKHTMRGFTRWAQVMGGFLNFHGLTGFLDNAGDLAERDTDAEEWSAFLARWHQVFGTTAKTSKELHASAQVDFVMGERIDKWSRCFITDDEGMTPNPRRLGMMLAGQEGRIRNGFILRKRMSHEKSQLWWVEKMEE
jgi:hypothetical protein